MTNEEAIKCIQVWINCYNCQTDCYDEKTNTVCELYHDMNLLDFEDALYKAIEALEILS